MPVKTKKYNHSVVESKWQARWLKEGTYSPNLRTAKRPFYNLMMFPYPSAEGLHIGNMYAFTGADIYGRFKRMRGDDVFEPIGLDGFGIHSENYAIKVGLHPKEHAKNSEKNFYRQLSLIGNGFDWDHRLETYDPEYYKWTQWLFIQMFKAGLAYKGKAMVNWCPSCKTVLADEQVVGEGVCERCGTKVEKREMSSWFFKITKYADRLLEGLSKINWPEKIKTAQRNWIGKSEGKKSTHYHLRDWLISRQRYWGPPIPMIFCKHCASKGDTFKGQALQDTVFKGMAGWFPMSEEDLPVLLPDIKDFKPKGDGTSPLHNAPDSWKKVKCPNCGKMAERELDVSDTFLDSAWYFLRYPSTRAASSGQVPFDAEITKKWLPVDAYIGGAEHAVLHLLYARFVTMALHDWGYLDFEEPFPFLFSHGLIIKDGAKMSKSRGNVVVPDTYIEKYGADTVRGYLMFLGPYDQGGDFRDTGIEGMGRFIQKLWRIFNGGARKLDKENRPDVYSKMHQTIKKVTEDIGSFKYNTAIARTMELTNVISEKGADEKVLENLVLLLAPFIPHMAEEVWCEVLGNKFSVHTSPWPFYDKRLVVSKTLVIPVQVNGKLRGQLRLKTQDSRLKTKIEKMAREDPNVVKWLEGKKIKKTIFVSGKVINFVTANGK